MMNYWQLFIFHQVIKQKSFSKAALIAHISQPTVSIHIKELEKQYGCKLIDRIDRTIRPTQAGKILFEKTKLLIALQEKTETAMAEFQGNIVGPLLIGGSTIPGEYLLPELIARFKKSYPNVFVSMSISDSSHIIQLIKNSEIEFGVIGTVIKDKSFKQTKLLDDHLHLIVPADHKWGHKKEIKLKQLLKEPLIFRQSGSGTLKTIYENLNDLDGERHQLNVVAELGSTGAVIRAIIHKMGISILSPLAVTEYLDAGVLKSLSIKGIDMNRGFFLTYHKNHTLSPAAQRFIDTLISEFVPDGQ